MRALAILLFFFFYDCTNPPFGSFGRKQSRSKIFRKTRGAVARCFLRSGIFGGGFGGVAHRQEKRIVFAIFFGTVSAKTGVLLGFCAARAAIERHLKRFPRFGGKNPAIFLMARVRIIFRAPPRKNGNFLSGFLCSFPENNKKEKGKGNFPSN